MKIKTEKSFYSFHHYNRDEDDEFNRTPRKFLSYQYDCISDTYYSTPHNRDLEIVLYESEKEDPSNAYRLLHFTEDLQLEARAFLMSAFGDDVGSGTVAFQDLVYVAFTQRYGIKNRKLSDLIFSKLLTWGNTVDDIMDELEGPYPDVEDDYPTFKRSLKSLDNRRLKQLQLSL